MLLTLRKKGSKCIYGIPPWYRAILLFVTGILGAAVFYDAKPTWGGIIIFLIALLSALYEERWTFDSESGLCSARLGLLIAAKGPSIALRDIEAIRIDVFAKGRFDQTTKMPENKMPRGSQARLILDTKDGQSFMLDSVPFKRLYELQATAKTLADNFSLRFVGSSE